MKLIDSYGPNPRVVRMFIAEKGITVPTVEVDLMGGECQGEAYKAINPTGTSPSFELDDGRVFAEAVTICEYLEELYPEPALIGATPEDRAWNRMWVRRVELLISEHMYNGFRYGVAKDHFKDRFYLIPEAAEGLIEKARRARQWLDGLMDGRDFIAGDQITLADIVLFCCYDFVKDTGPQPLDTNLPNLQPWYERMLARPSATASIHPLAEKYGWVA